MKLETKDWMFPVGGKFLLENGDYIETRKETNEFFLLSKGNKAVELDLPAVIDEVFKLTAKDGELVKTGIRLLATVFGIPVSRWKNKSVMSMFGPCGEDRPIQDVMEDLAGLGLFARYYLVPKLEGDLRTDTQRAVLRDNAAIPYANKAELLNIAQAHGISVCTDEEWTFVEGHNVTHMCHLDEYQLIGKLMDKHIKVCRTEGAVICPLFD